MTNPKQAPDAQRPCPKCGMEMKALFGFSNPATDSYRCPRTDEEHRLYAQLAERDATILLLGEGWASQAHELAERDARIAELLQEAKKDTEAMLSAAQTCRDGKEVVEYLRAQLAAEQQAHAATKEELRKADEALLFGDFNAAFDEAFARRQARNAQGAEGGE